MHSHQRVAAALVLVIVTGCGGGGCGGCAGGEDYTYPSRPAVDTVPVADAMKLRLSKDGLDFFRQAIPPLIDQALVQQGNAEGQINVPVPGTVFEWNRSPIEGDIFVADGRDGSPVSTMSIYTEAFHERLEMAFVDERDGIRLTIRDLQIGLDVILGADVGISVFGQRLTGIDAACVLGNGNNGPPPHALRVTVDILLFPTVGAEHLLDVDVNVRDVSIDGMDLNIHAGTPWRCDDGDLCVFGVCLDQSDRECTAILCPALDGVFNVVERIVALIEPALMPVLTQLGEFLVNNLVPPTPLRSDMQMRPGDLISALPSLEQAKPLGVHMAAMQGALAVNCDDRDPGDCGDSDNVGMDIAMQMGFEAVVENDGDFPAGCIRIDEELPRFPAPTPVTLPPRWSDEQGELHRYALGFGMAESSLNQLGWSVFTSGMLCIDISTADMSAMGGGGGVPALTSGMFGLLAGEITALAGGEAPVLVRIRPNSQPRFDMIAGAGPQDPQLQMVIDEMKLEVFIAVDRRFVRAFAVLMDIDMALQLSPEANDEGQPLLVVQVAEGPNIGNFDVVYDEPVAGSDLGGTLPALVDLVLGQFLADSLRFELDLATMLTDALGSPVTASVDQIEVRGEEGDELVIYTGLEVGEQNPSTMDYLPAAIRFDPRSLLVERGNRLEPTGQVRLEMQDAAGLEFSYRVDGGPWHVWTEADAQGWLTVRQAKLGLVGDHRIELRARPRRDWRATPKAVAPIIVTTRGAPPEVQAVPVRDGWSLRVFGGSADVSLLVRWTENGDVEPFEGDRIRRDQLVPGSRVEIYAQDSFGRRSAPARIDVPMPGGADRASAPSQAQGCNQLAVGPWLLLLVPLALRRRRCAA